MATEGTIADFASADALQDLLETGREQWPLPHEVGVLARIREWRAFSDSDIEELKSLCGWQRGPHQNMPYIPDPLPERIKGAFADLIVGAEPEFEAQGGSEDGSEPGPDQELLDDLIEENEFPSELWDAIAQMVAEGEVWWRIYVDRDAFEHPVVEWHSRQVVVPLWRGRKLLAVAFVNDVDDLEPDAPLERVGDDADSPLQQAWRESRAASDRAKDVYYRHVEVQAGGLVRNLLYRGTATTLGDQVPLDHVDAFSDLPPEWFHDLQVETRGGRSVPVMLAGRIANAHGKGRTGRVGRSQYAGVKNLLYELNKLQSVGSRNVDLTMQKRAVLPQEVVAAIRKAAGFTDEDGPTNVQLPDAFMMPRDQMGETGVMGVLEFSDAWAEALLAWDGGVVDKILTRTRVAPQLVGRHTEDAATGPALRARLLDSVLAADGKGRVVDDAIPKILRAVQMVDALSEEEGGCGHEWVNPEEPPIFVRTSILPEDENEEAIRHQTLVGSGLESRQTGIERLNPEWDDDRVQEELERIAAEQPEDPAEAALGAAPGTQSTAGPAGPAGAPTATSATFGDDALAAMFQSPTRAA